MKYRLPKFVSPKSTRFHATECEQCFHAPYIRWLLVEIYLSTLVVFCFCFCSSLSCGRSSSGFSLHVVLWQSLTHRALTIWRRRPVNPSRPLPLRLSPRSDLEGPSRPSPVSTISHAVHPWTSSCLAQPPLPPPRKDRPPRCRAIVCSCGGQAGRPHRAKSGRWRSTNLSRGRACLARMRTWVGECLIFPGYLTVRPPPRDFVRLSASCVLLPRANCNEQTD